MALFEFNTELAILQAEEYVRQILVEKFGAKVVVVGYNHTFGRKREGNGRLLKEFSAKYGFEARIQDPVLYNGEAVHSSRIRKELFEGRFREAMTMLNRPYRISGEVVRGRGVGRGLGYPTINVRAHRDKLIPMSGVYAAKVRFGGEWHPGMMYIGEDRSIFDLEVSIFDFEGDLYHRKVDVDIYDRTRDSIKFESTDGLVAQIAEDEKKIRHILSTI
jgi:riboflavin kinase/FMN adenylyltransferase